LAEAGDGIRQVGVGFFGDGLVERRGPGRHERGAGFKAGLERAVGADMIKDVFLIMAQIGVVGGGDGRAIAALKVVLQVDEMLKKVGASSGVGQHPAFPS
jgi:hypothetical protein